MVFVLTDIVEYVSIEMSKNKAILEEIKLVVLSNRRLWERMGECYGEKHIERTKRNFVEIHVPSSNADYGATDIELRLRKLTTTKMKT